jgi:hypothetical protein
VHLNNSFGREIKAETKDGKGCESIIKPASKSNLEQDFNENIYFFIAEYLFVCNWAMPGSLSGGQPEESAF